jgi:hypothetical protein
MAKVRIQARSADAEEALELNGPAPVPHEFHHKHGKHLGALEILARVWKREGFTGWYQVSHPFVKSCQRSVNSFIQGMQAQITKAVLSQALLFMSKEQFEHWALAIMIFASRLSSQH